MREQHGLWLILGAAVLWGTTGTAQALGPETSHPVAVGVMRLLVASPALLALAWRRRSLPARTTLLRAPVLLAALGMAAYQPAFFTAVGRTGVALGTVVAIGSAPVLTGALSWLLRLERPNAGWGTATLLGLAGVVLLGVTGRAVGVEPVGLAFALLAGLCFAVYILASRRALAEISPLGVTAVVFSLAALASLPLLALVDVSWVLGKPGLAVVLHLGLVATALAYVLFAAGLRVTPAATAATAALAEPITAAALGVVLVGERPGPPAWAGAALVMGGLAVLVRAPGRVALSESGALGRSQDGAAPRSEGG